MADGDSLVRNFLVSGVTQAMLQALTALGVAWDLDGTILCVHGRGTAAWEPPSAPIDCGNSATTLRLLAGVLAAAGIPAVLDGSPGLRLRPMGRIIEPLRLMGVEIEAAPGNCAPLHLAGRLPGRPLRAIQYTLPVASAQVKSCLLLAALAAEGETTLHEPGLSRDHTERMLSGLGVRVEAEQTVNDTPAAPGETIHTVRLIPPASLVLPPLNTNLPGDLSAAAFLIVGALIAPGSSIYLENVGLNPTRSGILDALVAMGADIRATGVSERCGEPVGDLEIRSSALRAVHVGGELVVRMIDEFPAFAAAAAFSQGTTLVQDAAELRNKESDRISALCLGLRALGVHAGETGDGFVIQGGLPVAGGQAEAFGDHRLAMALSLIGLASAGPVTVAGSEIIRESFPNFVAVLSALGAQVSTTGGPEGGGVDGS
jgi:3-phosphoshikimate 1-carboxyvinyltransferase